MNNIDNISERLTQIYTYLVDEVGLGSTEMRSIKSAVNMIHQMTPIDGPGVFDRINSFISASDDLSWVITCISNRITKISSELKAIKDPQFTILVRQGRPSIQAIESEIRYTHNEVRDLEETLETLRNINDYFIALNNNVDKYIWMLRDKAKFIAK